MILLVAEKLVSHAETQGEQIAIVAFVVVLGILSIALGLAG